MSVKLADWIWMDGEFVPWEDAKLHIRTECVNRGSNVFEGVRGYWNEDQQEMFLFKIPQHIRRLYESTKIMHMYPALAPSDWGDVMVELIKRNNFRGDIYLRPTVYFGEGMDVFAYTPDRIFTGAFVIASPTKCRLEWPAGISCCVSSWCRIGDTSMPPRIKIGANYQNSRLAAVEASINGYDGAILLNQQGKVAEGPGACVFMVRNGVAFTTPVTSGILESITRDTLIGLFESELDTRVVVRDIDRTELYVADEVFFCGTAYEITPIASVDRYAVGNGEIGPLTRRLRELYHGILRGSSSKYREWLTPVYQGR